MSRSQNIKLKDAVEKMDQVVGTLKYHTKLKIAWRDLNQAIKEVNKPDGPKQDEMFPKS